MDSLLPCVPTTRDRRVSLWRRRRGRPTDATLLLFFYVLIAVAATTAAAVSCSTTSTTTCAPLAQVVLPANDTAVVFSTNGAAQNLFYANNLLCIWNVTAPPGMRTVLWFTLVDVEVEPSCLFDALRVFDSVAPALPLPHATSVFQSANVSMVAVLCGNYNNSLPDPYVLGSSSMLALATDTAGTARGFIAVAQAVTPSVCTPAASVAVGDVFGVYSPSPVGSALGAVMPFVPSYGYNTRCTWNVSFPSPSGGAVITGGYVVVRSLTATCVCV